MPITTGSNMAPISPVSLQQQLEALLRQRGIMANRRNLGPQLSGPGQYGELMALDEQIRALQGQLAGSAGGPGGVSAGGGGFTPQFYGIGDFDKWEKQFVEERTPGLLEQFTAPGGGEPLFGSSVFGVAAGQLAGEAGRSRWALEANEMARRTDWEQTEAMRQWREREGQTQRNFQWQMMQRQMAAQRRMQMWADSRAFADRYGQMDVQNRMNVMGLLGQYQSAAPPEFQGWLSQMNNFFGQVGQ